MSRSQAAVALGLHNCLFCCRHGDINFRNKNLAKGYDISRKTLRDFFVLVERKYQ